MCGVILGSGILASDRRGAERRKRTAVTSWRTLSVYDPRLPSCVTVHTIPRAHASSCAYTGRRDPTSASWQRPRRGPLQIPCRPAVLRKCVRRDVECRGCSPFVSHVRVSPMMTSRRAYTTALPNAAGFRRRRAAEIEVGQPAGGACRRVRLEDREPVGALDELHRRAPARVDFDRLRNPVASDEVDAVDADETEFIDHRLASALAASASARSSSARMFPQYWYPAAPKAGSPTSCRDMPSVRRGRRRRRTRPTRVAVDELLQIAAARQRVAPSQRRIRCPPPDASGFTSHRDVSGYAGPAS